MRTGWRPGRTEILQGDWMTLDSLDGAAWRPGINWDALRFSKITIYQGSTNQQRSSSALLPFFGNHLGGHRYPPGPPALNESYGLSMIIRDDPRSSMIIHKRFFIIIFIMDYPPKYPKPWIIPPNIQNMRIQSF